MQAPALSPCRIPANLRGCLEAIRAMFARSPPNSPTADGSKRSCSHSCQIAAYSCCYAIHAGHPHAHAHAHAHPHQGRCLPPYVGLTPQTHIHLHSHCYSNACPLAPRHCSSTVQRAAGSRCCWSGPCCRVSVPRLSCSRAHGAEQASTSCLCAYDFIVCSHTHTKYIHICCLGAGAMTRCVGMRVCLCCVST